MTKMAEHETTSADEALEVIRHLVLAGLRFEHVMVAHLEHKVRLQQRDAKRLAYAVARVRTHVAA